MERSTSYIMKNSGKMIIDPFMEDLPELFRSYFVSILKVGYKIPRLEYYLTQGIFVILLLLNIEFENKLFLFFSR